jgi:hypothetical protein
MLTKNFSKFKAGKLYKSYNSSSRFNTGGRASRRVSQRIYDSPLLNAVNDSLSHRVSWAPLHMQLGRLSTRVMGLADPSGANGANFSAGQVAGKLINIIHKSILRTK